MKASYLTGWVLILLGAFFTLVSCGSKVEDPVIIPPAEITATVGPAEVTLLWPAIQDSSYYLVFWDSAANVTRTDNYVISYEPGVVIRDLKNSVEYFFAVASVSLSGVVGGLSAEVSAIPLPNAPSTPTNLSAVSDIGQITLSWSGPRDADSYNVYYNTVGGVSDTDPSFEVTGATSYVHAGLPAGVTYFYRISAVNTGGESGLSAEVSGTPVEELLLDEDTGIAG